MISITKGLKYLGWPTHENYVDKDKNLVSCLFEFRSRRIDIYNLVKKDSAPFLGCELTKDDVINLIEFLQRCLADKKCDKCWDKTIPEGMEFSGDVKCAHCGEVF